VTLDPSSLETNAKVLTGKGDVAATIDSVVPQLSTHFDKIVVAIHGIGSQDRSGTIRTVASRFGDRCTPPLPVQPLGFFNVGGPTDLGLEQLALGADDEYLKHVAFAEIFWADIPKEVVKEADLLEETKAWGRTVVSRAEATYNVKVPKDERRLTPADFGLGIGVVDEIIETVGVLENLLAVADKAGIFKFDLAPLLRDYIGDVQIVADFPMQRDRILYRFHSALGTIVAAVEAHNTKLGNTSRPEIYIVAHSEGTVISFLGLLEALSGKVAHDPDGKTADFDSARWIGDVRGFMTIGSPIDKHLVLWPSLWKDVSEKIASRPGANGSIVFGRASGPPVSLPTKIKWRNYYDYGDPIGFQLDTAVEFLCEKHCAAFEFETAKHDIGFSRYALPGKAHNDYWTDAAVFGHFIDDVVLQTGQAKRPENLFWQGRVSTLLPFILILVIHFAAVFVLYKGMTAFTNSATLESLPRQMSLFAVLLTCITVAARLPRLVKTDGWRWHAVALLFFVIGALCIWALPVGSQHYLGGPFVSLFASGSKEGYGERTALVIVEAVIASSGWWVERVPARGRRWLIATGAAVIAYAVVVRLWQAPEDSPVWPVMLAGAAFLYLWWLGILLFDLTFVWHRYIRNSVAVDALRQWRRGKEMEPRSAKNLWERPAPPKTKAP